MKNTASPELQAAMVDSRWMVIGGLFCFVAGIVSGWAILQIKQGSIKKKEIPVSCSPLMPDIKIMGMLMTPSSDGYSMIKTAIINYGDIWEITPDQSMRIWIEKP